MTNGASIIRAVAHYRGFDREHVQHTGGYLSQSGEWPNSASKATAMLLFALLADSDPRKAASVATQYYNLPATGFETAGNLISSMLESFMRRSHTDFSAWAYRSGVEVYATATPAVKITTPCTDGMLEIVCATPEWHDATVRHSHIITGKTLFDIAADISVKVAA